MSEGLCLSNAFYSVCFFVTVYWYFVIVFRGGYASVRSLPINFVNVWYAAPKPLHGLCAHDSNSELSSMVLSYLGYC